jgi:uncharacterized protein YodC (DUF2158 family)
MNEFKRGDHVALKSGSPGMVVYDIGDDSLGRPTVWCEWMVGNKKFTETFAPTSLNLVNQ